MPAVGQAVCDRIDVRHQAILPPDVWGDGEEEGVRRRAAERMKDTARAAARFGVTQVNGFTGSSIWHLLYSFPPNDFAEIERGYEVFAEAWSPILDVFDAEGVRFGLEVHPTEIAYDFVTTEKTLATVGRRPAFGINLDPSHFAHQHLDTAAFALQFADRIYHVHVKDSKKRLDGRRSRVAFGHYGQSVTEQARAPAARGSSLPATETSRLDAALFLELCDLDRDREGLDDLPCRGCDPRRSDDGGDRGEDAADLLGVDIELARCLEVHQVRDRRGIDRHQRRDANEHQRLRVEAGRLDRVRSHAREQVEDRGFAC